MTAEAAAAYWAAQSSDRRPVLTAEEAGLTDAMWSVGWE